MKGVTALVLGILAFVLVLVIVGVFLVKYTSAVDYGVELLGAAFEPFKPMFS